MGERQRRDREEWECDRGRAHSTQTEITIHHGRLHTSILCLPVSVCTHLSVDCVNWHMSAGRGSTKPLKWRRKMKQEGKRMDGELLYACEPLSLVAKCAPSPDMDANYGGGLLDMVKGGAGKFFSNFKDNLKDTLKDTSRQVMSQVST